MAELARVAEENELTWLDNVVPIFRNLWSRVGNAHFILLHTEDGTLCGLVTRVRPGVFAWQIEFSGREESNFLEAPLEATKSLVERGLMALIESRGGRWWPAPRI